MWDEQKQQELDTLRRREQAGTLTTPERRRLDDFLAALDHDEWGALHRGLQGLGEEQQRLQTERRRLSEQNAAIAALAERYEALLTRDRAQVEQLTQERDALRGEVGVQIAGGP